MATPCSSWITHEVSLVSIDRVSDSYQYKVGLTLGTLKGRAGSTLTPDPSETRQLPIVFLCVYDQTITIEQSCNTLPDAAHSRDLYNYRYHLTFSRFSFLFFFFSFFSSISYGSALTWSLATVRYEAAHSRLAKRFLNGFGRVR